MARGIIILGLIIVAIGVIWLAFPKALSWFGRLPGDINIQRENTSVVIPITSMIIVSVILTLISNIIAWFAKR
jgi:amino acid permease